MGLLCNTVNTDNNTSSDDDGDSSDEMVSVGTGERIRWDVDLWTLLVSCQKQTWKRQDWHWDH